MSPLKGLEQQSRWHGRKRHRRRTLGTSWQNRCDLSRRRENSPVETKKTVSLRERPLLEERQEGWGLTSTAPLCGRDRSVERVCLTRVPSPRSPTVLLPHDAVTLWAWPLPTRCEHSSPRTAGLRRQQRVSWALQALEVRPQGMRGAKSWGARSSLSSPLPSACPDSLFP